MKYRIEGGSAMHELNYGKYAVPVDLLKLITLEQRLNEQGLLKYGDLLGLYFALEPVKMRYLNTPVDVIPFAHTGGDGIHFGFLTDFGEVSCLEQAYIVRVEPMNFDEPVKLVARNLTDFIGLMCRYVYAVDTLDITSSKLKIERYLVNCSTYELEQQEVLRLCSEELRPVQIESLVHYFEELKYAREAELVVQTDDGIGVVKTRVEPLDQFERFVLARDMRPNLNVVKHYFALAPLTYKLAFIRDAQSYGILFNEHELKQWVIEELQRQGFETEAVRLSFS